MGWQEAELYKVRKRLDQGKLGDLKAFCALMDLERGGKKVKALRKSWC